MTGMSGMTGMTGMTGMSLKVFVDWIEDLLAFCM